MKKLKILIILSAVFAVATFSESAGSHLGGAKARHPELQRALKSLTKSREDLMKATRDYGGHRTKAVQAIDTAIDEIKQALAFSG